MQRIFVLAAVLLLACNPEPTDPAGNAAGQWSGRIRSEPHDADIVLTLRHNRSTGAVTGTGSWGAGIPLTVSGRASGLSMIMTLNVASAVGSVSFNGTLSTGRMTGTMSGVGFQPASVTFTRQAAE